MLRSQSNMNSAVKKNAHTAYFTVIDTGLIMEKRIVFSDWLGELS